MKRRGRAYYLGKDQESVEAHYLEHVHRIERGQPIIEYNNEELTVSDIGNHLLIAQE